MQQCGNHVPHLHISFTLSAVLGSADGHTYGHTKYFIHFHLCYSFWIYIYICLYILLTFKVDSPTWKYSPHETSKLFQNFQTSLSCMRLQEPKNTWAQIKLKCLYQNYSEICCTKCFSSLHFQIQCAIGIHSRKQHSTFGPNEYFIRQNKYALVDSLINIFFSVHFSYNMIKFFDCMDKKSSTIKENWMRKLQNEIQENQPKMWFLYTFFFLVHFHCPT